MPKIKKGNLESHAYVKIIKNIIIENSILFLVSIYQI